MDKQQIDENIVQPEDAKAEKKWLRNFLEWLAALAVALLAALFITQVLLVNARVPSESMENTIMTGDRIIGNRLAYMSSKPKRGDIVIFHYPDDESQLYIKRVIGMPGDVVDIREGKVYINESETPLEEPYLKETPVGDYGPYEVPEGSYFVMGDNRNRSSDSRFWDNKFVAEDKIIGSAAFRLYPNPGAI